MKDLEDAMKYKNLRIIFLDESKVKCIKCIFLIVTEEIFLKEKKISTDPINTQNTK